MAEAKDDNPWAIEKIDELICLVRANNVLYDQSLPGYANRELIENVWNCIAARLKKTPSQTTKKWQVLRAGYRKRRKDYLPGPSGSAAKKKKKWSYFDSLQFLEPYLEERKSITNVPEETIEETVETDSQISSPVSGSQMYAVDDEQVILVVNNENTEEEISDVEPRSRTGCNKGKKKVNARELADMQMAEYLNILKKKHTEKNKKSSMEQFLLSLVEEAEGLSPQKQTMFKIRVLEIFQELQSTS